MHCIGSYRKEIIPLNSQRVDICKVIILSEFRHLLSLTHK
jgi:hypothetical protein